MARVRFWNDARDLKAEYFRLKSTQPAVADAIRDAITLVCADPDSAARWYSTELDPEAGYQATPYREPGGLMCLVWRPRPDGDDAIEIVDYSQPWGDELEFPARWPPT